MSLKNLTNSIEKQGTSSGGVSLKNYNRRWNRSQSNDQEVEEPISKVYFLLDDDVPTNVWSSRALLDPLVPYIRDPNRQILINQRILASQTLREAFLLDAREAYLKSLDAFRYPYTSSTPALELIQSDNFPAEIRGYIHELLTGQEDEDRLYEVADEIADWLIDQPDEYQALLASYLGKMPLISQRIFMATLSDAEVVVTNKILLQSIGLCLESSDKRVAQAAATCLLTCGRELGEEILRIIIETKDLPHLQLIEGIVSLLSSR